MTATKEINKKEINKDITRLAIPVVLENMLQILANVITAAMIGRLLDSAGALPKAALTHIAVSAGPGFPC